MNVQEPVAFDPFMQKDASDCGVACLQMMTGLSYEQVLKACPRKAKQEGLSNRQLLNVAKKLGFPLRYIKTTEPGHHVGILDLHRPADPANRKGEWEGHFVMFMRNSLYNPAEGTVWTDVDTFLKTRRWEPLGIFVREGQTV